MPTKHTKDAKQGQGDRQGSEDAPLVAASELSSLLATAHLLRSPKNAERLLTALNRAKSRKLKPQSIEKLRREMGLDSTEQKSR
jgi:antitoxin YefM